MPAASGLVIGNVDRSLVEALRARGIELLASPGATTLDDPGATVPDVVCLAFSLAAGVAAPVESIRERFADAAVLLVVPARELVAGEAVARLLDADVVASPVDSRRASQAIARVLARRERRRAHARLVERAHTLDPELAAAIEQLARDHEETVHALDEALAFRSVILANLAHEVRTPLAVVHGFADLLEDDFGGALDADQRELVQAIRGGCGQLVAVFQGLVDLARAETGQIDHRPASVFLPDLLGEAVRDVAPALQKRPVRLTIDVDRRLGWIRTQPDWVRQILACLLSNAAKFTHEGEIRLSARLVREGAGDSSDPITVLLRAPARDGSAVEIEVADTGIGIAPEQQAQMFEAFRQEDPSMTRAHEGLGIGLTVVRELAKEIDATLRLESRRGEGTTVRVRIPFDPLHGESPKQREPRNTGVARSRSGPSDPTTEIAHLHRLTPASFDEAIPLALHALDRGTGARAAFFASGGPSAWRLVDSSGDAASSPAPPEGLLDRASNEGRASGDAGPSDRWYAVAVRGAPGAPAGALFCRAPAEGEAEVSSALQAIGGWLGLVHAVRSLSAERIELAAAISRSIKDPLGSLLAYTQVLLRGLRGSLSEEQRTIVLRVEKGIHRAILAALDVLDFERAIGTRATAVSRPFPIASVVDHVLARHASALELARIGVDRSAVDGEASCQGDEIRTDRALSGLLRAFVDGAPSPGTIALAAHTENRRVVLELRGRVLEPRPFERALSGSPARLGFDETLGLALARVAIEAQAGTIVLRAEEAELVVAIALPRAPADST